MIYLVCYDIADDRRRRRVARLLEGFGQRLHESAFLLRLRQAQLSRLKRRLPPLLDEHADHVLIYPLCRRDQPDIVHLAASSAPALDSAVIV